MRHEWILSLNNPIPSSLSVAISFLDNFGVPQTNVSKMEQGSPYFCTVFCYVLWIFEHVSIVIKLYEGQSMLVM